MKRSEKLLNKAARSCWLSSAIMTGSCAAGIWSLALWDTNPPATIFLAIASLAGIATAIIEAKMTLQYSRWAYREARFEHEKSIRPRI